MNGEAQLSLLLLSFKSVDNFFSNLLQDAVSAWTLIVIRDRLPGKVIRLIDLASRCADFNSTVSIQLYQCFDYDAAGIKNFSILHWALFSLLRLDLVLQNISLFPYVFFPMIEPWHLQICKPYC